MTAHRLFATRWAIAWAVWTLAGACDTHAYGQDLRQYDVAEVHMGMPFRLIFYSADEHAANEAAKEAFARIAELDRTLSDYDPASELSRLCDTAGSGRSVPVSQDLWNVLAAADRLSALTEGAFDVTLGRYTRLWRRSRRQHRLPSQARLDEARQAVGHALMRLDAKAQSVELTRAGMQLDLGGIAVGYTIDRVAEILVGHGITRYLIDASGDIRCGDPPPGESAWRIGIAPLEAPDGPPSRHLALAKMAVTTSGDAMQYVDIDGVRYSHIVDPATGLGLTTPSSVTVIARDGLTADSVATAVSVLGVDKGLALIEATPDAAALILRRDGDEIKAYESERLRSYLAD